ncbi:MAG: 3-ketoacyl-ACP reductase [Verrucomicrobia bacterium]|nr:3-ketoacyl-ACP reductase [Verrucomicrobiota bacterium]
MNPVALITGASRGIGRGIALELAKIGHDLVINYAGNAEAAAQTRADCLAVESKIQSRVRETCEANPKSKIRAEICQADVGIAADRQRLIDFTRQTFGRLDLLVNNAGVTSRGRKDVLEATEENFDWLIAINLKGPFFLSQLAANWMIEQKKSSPASYRPKIVTVTSISAYTVSMNRADYCMGKAALSMMVKIFAARLAEHGINVYEVCPGVIASDMTAPVKAKYDKLIAEGLTPIRRWGEPEDVGRAVVAIAQDLLPFSTGEVINVDGGFHIRTV